MALFLKYGSYKHDPGEVEIHTSRQPLFTEGRTLYAYLYRWELAGLLTAASASEMDAKALKLVTAYSRDNQDLALWLRDENGAETMTHMALINSETRGGVQVVSGPNFPNGKNAVYVTHLPYTIVVEGVVAVSDPATLLLSYTESVSYEGGGPRYGMIETKTGRPVRQLLRRYTVFRAEQQGRAVGLYGLPMPSPPLWPQWLAEDPKITRVSPRRFGDSNEQYEVNWAYIFEAPNKLLMLPHVWR